MMASVCVGTTFQKLHSPPVSKSDEVFKNVNLSSDKEVWRLYRQPDDEKEIPPCASLATATACYQARLFRLVSRINSLYCGAMGRVKWTAIAELYDQIIVWKRNLPIELHVSSNGFNPLPHVLYLQ